MSSKLGMKIETLKRELKECLEERAYQIRPNNMKIKLNVTTYKEKMTKPEKLKSRYKDYCMLPHLTKR